MFLSQEEFNRVLYTDNLIDITYLVHSALLLKKLALIYEKNENMPSDVTLTAILENQVILSATHIKELACVALKALKDGHLDSLTGI